MLNDFTVSVNMVLIVQSGLCDCFSDGATAYSRARYGQGPASQKIILDDVGCIGTETNLGQCNYTALGLSNCDHTEDAGVMCHPGKSTYVPVRSRCYWTQFL